LAAIWVSAEKTHGFTKISLWGKVNISTCFVCKMLVWTKSYRLIRNLVSTNIRDGDVRYQATATYDHKNTILALINCSIDLVFYIKCLNWIEIIHGLLSLHSVQHLRGEMRTKHFHISWLLFFRNVYSGASRKSIWQLFCLKIEST